MARSRKKNPGCGYTTADSDKPFKQQEHRRERVALRLDLTTDEPPVSRQFGNPWHGEKDGKQWFDAERHPEIMRK